MKKIDFFIVGIQKAATSSYAELLRQHSQVTAPYSEKNWFLTDGLLNKHQEEINDYLASCVSTNIIGIKCPDYFPTSGVASRICQHNSNAKIIILTRPPTDRFISACFWYMQAGIVPVMNINKLISLVFDKDFLDKYPGARQLLPYGNYYESLNEYLRIFGKKNILIVSQSKFHKDKANVINKTLDFLNVSATNNINFENPKAKKTSIYNPYRLRYLSFINKMFFYKFHNTQDLFYSTEKSKVHKVFFMAGNAIDKLLLKPLFGNGSYNCSDSSIEKLNRYYQHDSQLFEKTIKNMDLSHD